MSFNRDQYPLPIPDGHWYDKEAADKAVNFIELLCQFKGRYAGKSIELMKWQEDRIIRPLFGLKRPDGTRQYREAFIFIPAKNGKSTLVAGIGLKLVYADGEAGAEVYGAAYTRDQAGIVFDVARNMVKQNDRLNDLTKEYVRDKKLLYENTNSFYQAISRDAAGSEGYDAHGVIFDEVHRQPDRELYDVLTTRQGAREQPLVVSITTAGESKEGTLAGELLDYAKGVESGDINDPSFFSFVCTAEDRLQIEGVDWTDRDVWYYANPALERPGIDEDEAESGFRKLDELERAIERAQEVPAARPGILRRYLNIWRSSSEGFIEEREWNELATDYEEGELYGQPAWGGLDLSSTIDLTAWVMVVPTGESIAVVPRLFVPRETIVQRSREDKVPYDVWEDEGHLITTPGEAIDERIVQKKIEEDAELFDIQTIGFDPWNASRLFNELEEFGLTLIEIRQGMRSMSPPTKEFIRLIKQDKMIHNNNPVMNWMINNIRVRTDQNENMMPSKKKSTDRIDGVVALLMAIDQWVRENEREHTKSVYEDRGMVSI